MADQPTQLTPDVLALIAKVEGGGALSQQEFQQLVAAARNLPPQDPDFMRIAKAVTTERMAGMSEQGNIPGMKSPQLATTTESDALATNKPGPEPTPPTSIGDLLGGAVSDIPIVGQAAAGLFGIGPQQPAASLKLPPSTNPVAQALHITPAAQLLNDMNPHGVHHEEVGSQLFSPPGLAAGEVGAADAIDSTDYSKYSFGGNLSALDQMFSDPEGAAMEALALAQQRGGSQSAAHFLLPYVQAAMQLAPTGALGGVQGSDLMGGPGSPAQQMKAVEDFLNATRNKSVNPGELMGNVLKRTENSTPKQMQEFLAKMGETVDASQLQDPEIMIKTTRDELTAAAQYLTPQAREAFNNLLAVAEINYKKGRADGKIMMTYPAYLEAIGIPEYFGAHSQ